HRRSLRGHPQFSRNDRAGQRRDAARARAPRGVDVRDHPHAVRAGRQPYLQAVRHHHRRVQDRRRRAHRPQRPRHGAGAAQQPARDASREGRGDGEGGHRHPAARRPDAGGARCHLHGDGARPRIEALGDDGGPLRLHRPHGVHLVPHALGGVDARAPAGADGDAHPHPPDGPRVVRNRRAIHHRRPEDVGRGGFPSLKGGLGQHHAKANGVPFRVVWAEPTLLAWEQDATARVSPNLMPHRLIVLWCLTGVWIAGPLAAQEPHVRFSGQAIALLTTTNAVPGGATLTEGRLVQPVLMLEGAALGDHLQLHAMGDFEGWTIQHGHLATGAYGEGYYDRRHPHTYVHELMFTGGDLLGRWDGDVVVSLSAGKGFAPFGTDDPMSRPPMLYPANHHLAQILERAVAVTAITAGKVTLEGGTFNGDEPEYPSQWPKWNRFGDSWA